MYTTPAADLQLMDKRLIEIYGEAQCLKWKTESPAYLAYQTFELIQGHIISKRDDVDVDEKEMESLESVDPINFPVDEVAFENPSFFNPYRFNVQRLYLKRKYYKIGKTDFVLILLSGEELRKKFEES
jgi:hypothetical protein